MNQTIDTARRWMRGAFLEAWRTASLTFSLRNVEHQEPILVLQMGKVGSSSVVDTLRRLGLPNPILQVHTLSRDHIEHARRRQRSSSSPFLHEHLIVSRILEKKYSRGVVPCRIITLTREPVARAISFIFQDLRKQAPEALSGEGLDVCVVLDRLIQLLSSDSAVSDPTIWFDRELKPFGVDVFEQPYDFDKGYSIIQRGRVSVLLLRLEDLNRSLRPALSEFLSMDEETVPLGRNNASEDKWYASAVTQVKEELHLPAETLRRILDSRYARHFYQWDRARIIERWSACDAGTVREGGRVTI